MAIHASIITGCATMSARDLTCWVSARGERYGKQVMDSQLSLQERAEGDYRPHSAAGSLCPYSKNGFRYRQVYEPGCEYAIYQRQSVLKEEWDEWEILLDANQRAAKSEFYTGRTGHCAQQPANGGGGRLPFPPPVRPALCDLSNGEWYPEILENVTSGFAEQRFTLCLVCA